MVIEIIEHDFIWYMHMEEFCTRGNVRTKPLAVVLIVTTPQHFLKKGSTSILYNYRLITVHISILSMHVSLGYL